jgi:hypothetical protein
MTRLFNPFARVAALVLLAGGSPVHADRVSLSPQWSEGMPAAPLTNVKITEAYARHSPQIMMLGLCGFESTTARAGGPSVFPRRTKAIPGEMPCQWKTARRAGAI